MRRAAKIDGNQPAIVEALKRIGAKAYYLKKPVDLLVGYRGKNYVIEVKNKNGKDEMTTEQAEFMATWPGEVHVVYTPEEAVAVVIGPEAMR
jgi:hypothetical protein